jgi:tRNA dimethylallyltransferase
MSLPKARLPLVVIVGPTAVGKTGLAIQLAQHLNAEIVSADSRLFYRGLDIGTAKPTRAEMISTPHHLIDVANPDETWSLAVFQQKAQEVIKTLHDRRKLPLLVGGTGQYIRAVTEGWTPPKVQPDPRLRNVLEALAIQYSPAWLHERLRILDPLSADRIDARNLRRTVRALEVIFTSGQLFSTQRSISESPYQLINIGLVRPRSELYSRIDERIELMFANGLLHEVKVLLEKGYSPELPSLSAIGYREAIAVLQGKMSLDAAKMEMKRITRIFVRRQANWFKPDDPNIRWFEMNATTVTVVEEFIRARLGHGGIKSQL